MKHFKRFLSGIFLLVGIVIGNLALAEELPQADFSGAPPFLNKKQILHDLVVFEGILREGYGRYEVLKKNGLNWNQELDALRHELVSLNRPVLTQHFQERLIEFLQLTEDPTFEMEVQVYQRHYQHKVILKRTPYFSTLRLANENNRYRSLPTQNYYKVANQWLAGCHPKTFRYFPVIPERKGEPLFQPGILAEQFSGKLYCIFANDLFETTEVALDLTQFKAEPRYFEEDRPVFEWVDGPFPYLRWYRDSTRKSERDGFFRLTSKLRKHVFLIFDVRNNTEGSFSFIEPWLAELTNQEWKNVIMKEKQSVMVLKSLIHRIQWQLQKEVNLNLDERAEKEKKRQQYFALMQHMRNHRIPEKWVETKFILTGSPTAIPWNKTFIVLANRNCGDGCQFIAALAKQLKNGYLVGENTGSFSRASIKPLFVLPNSKIRFTVDHTVQSNYKGDYVPPIGYEPDFWLFPQFTKTAIYRLARSLAP